jgi:hypothetical protein
MKRIRRRKKKQPEIKMKRSNKKENKKNQEKKFKKRFVRARKKKCNEKMGISF